MRTHTENMTRVRVRDLYIDEAHTMLDIFRFAVFVFTKVEMINCAELKSFLTYSAEDVNIGFW